MTDSRDTLLRPRVLAAAVGVIAFVATFLAAASWTGDPAASSAAPAVADLLAGLLLPIIWLAAAAGFGWPLIHRLWPPPVVIVQQRGRSLTRPFLQLALGIAGLLFLDGALGRLGLLTGWNGGGAIVLTAIGIGLLAVQLARALPRPISAFRPNLPSMHPLGWLAAPAVAILFLAAVTPPGWLWASEFGGYDVLSYHLQLPREWLELGRMRGLEHNVYSYLPSSMEAAYLHLAALTGDAHRAAIPAQILHALIGLIAAIGTALAIRPHAGSRPAALAFGLVITLPWTVVVGSLAYNEMPLLLFLAAGLAIALPEPAEDGLARIRFRSGLIVGLLAGSAAAAKLTAAGFVALPLAVLLLMPMRRAGSGSLLRPVAIRLGAFALGSLIPLLPWVIGNAIQTGNPVFPFAAGLLGSAHWTMEQASNFRAAHAFTGPLTDRLLEGARQLPLYGLGASPYSGEPWKPQWALLPWLTLVATLTGLIRPVTRPIAIRIAVVMLIQLLFWLMFTHIKSRFMLPMVVPGSIALASLAVVWPKQPDQAEARERSRTSVLPTLMTSVLAVVVVAQAVLTLMIYRSEQNRSPAAAIGALDVFTGDSPAFRHAPPEELAFAPPAYWTRHRLTDDARLLALGAADPFYWWTPATIYATVWDTPVILKPADLTPAHLRDAGYTHFLIDPAMLDNWAERGWGDADAILGALPSLLDDPATTVIHEFPGGRLLVALHQDVGSAAPRRSTAP